MNICSGPFDCTVMVTLHSPLPGQLDPEKARSFYVVSTCPEFPLHSASKECSFTFT